jgi:hypothetical protein
MKAKKEKTSKRKICEMLHALKGKIFFFKKKIRDYSDRVDVLGSNMFPVMVGRSNLPSPIDTSHLLRPSIHAPEFKN